MSFRKFLNEIKDMLDISILAAEKYITSPEKLNEFMSNEVKIEAKTDGVKLTVIKIANNGNLNDYIFSYKGNVLYTNEYDYQFDDDIKKCSIGASQFKLVFSHFNSLGKNSIPVNTELQIEYLMSKPTLSSNYTYKHGMVLIGYSKSTYDIKFGKLKTKNSGMNIDKREQYAKELKINTPAFLFKGILGDQKSFENGINNDQLLNLYRSRKFTWENYQILYNEIKDLFLEVPSIFGGKEEGVVLTFIKSGKIFKWQQEYQLDQIARGKIKQKYQEENVVSEAEYWEKVKEAAKEIIQDIKFNTIEEGLKKLASKLKKFEPIFSHSKKNEVNIKDDIQLNAKNLMLKSMKGNNGCLILGKFRILTNGHYKLINDAIKDYDNVAVCVVTGKETEATKDYRIKMLKDTFGNKITLVESNNGNILRILQKVDFNINVIFSGSDRVESYKSQIKNVLGTEVREMKRTAEDISASKVIEYIEDEKYFKNNTPKTIHKLYNDLLTLYRK